jgi:hypothetical protein
MGIISIVLRLLGTAVWAVCIFDTIIWRHYDPVLIPLAGMLVFTLIPSGLFLRRPFIFLLALVAALVPVCVMWLYVLPHKASATSYSGRATWTVLLMLHPCALLLARQARSELKGTFK